MTARSDSDLTPEKIIQKVADASGSKYSGGPSIPSSGGPPPVAAKKPVFTPTQVGGGSSGFNPLGSRSRVAAPRGDEDQDGWGADAPPVTRSQLEKVQSAYKPTKVNMAELTSKKPEPSRFQAPQGQSSNPDVVKGGYQPIGKVDIAALRAQAKQQGQDDRPTVVKGAYEPVGKVDIAAIRAKAQGAPSGLSPAATGSSNRSNEEEAPKPVSERSAAFSTSERLTSLPKPKVANKFGGASAFTGTKAPTPTGFGSKPVAPAAPVGTASKTFADQGGKTPAQIWAEKKRAQGGISPSTTGGLPSPAATLGAQKSGEGGWKSGYTGKSWAPVQTTKTGGSATSNLSNQRTGEEPQREEESSPAGGVGALKDRFAGAAPMGAPTTRAVPEPQAPPPPMDMSSKPNAGARGVPIPGLPSRPAQPEEEDVPEVQHQRMPSPPPQPPRSPSPEPSGSPVRIAMPVARGREPEEMSPAEEKAPPMPTRSLNEAAQQARSVSPEPQTSARDPARGAGAAVAAATFGAAAVAGAGVAAAATAGSGSGGAGKRALIQYDYEKAEDNEIDLREGEYVTNIDMVDEDWWMGQNAQGETGLFPSNYVELVEGDDDEAGGVAADEPAAPPLPTHPSAAEDVPPAGPPQPAGGAGGPTATALYDYDAAEDNELSFPEGATITGVVCIFLSLFRHVGSYANLFTRNSRMRIGGLGRIMDSRDCFRRIMFSLMSKG